MKIRPSKNVQAVAEAYRAHLTDVEIRGGRNLRGIVNAHALGIGANPRRAKRETKPVIAKRERVARGHRYARGVWPCSLSVLS